MKWRQLHGTSEGHGVWESSHLKSDLHTCHSHRHPLMSDSMVVGGAVAKGWPKAVAASSKVAVEGQD
eukprot:4061652-Amphidinium_carterae.1